MKLSDFDYDLPEHLIAQQPSDTRGASRLIVIRSEGPVDRNSVQHRHFPDLLSWLNPHDLLVFNDTRVMHARLFAHKPTGGRVELLIERIHHEHAAKALIRSSHAPKPGSTLSLGPDPAAEDIEVISCAQGVAELAFKRDIWSLMDEHGQLPLPPYITHSPDAHDEQRYQTCYAQHLGSVAAPTAGLHFTPDLLSALDSAGIQRLSLTLHVGAGTFMPVRTENIAEHHMHAEYYSIPVATRDALRTLQQHRLQDPDFPGRIIAVGTTSLRALESWAWQDDKSSSDTSLFITPGYQFNVVDALITNFHLPKSTLLMLVSAFAGVETIRRAYALAIAEQYRFFSYGDAMFLSRRVD